MTGPVAELFLADAIATEALGARLAAGLRQRRGWVVYLRGELGAGKTTLARGLLRALGARGTIRSPSYTLVEPYEIDGSLVLHLDLYRLNQAAELEQLGLADTPPQMGGWLIEWPERGSAHLPPPSAELRLEPREEGRLLRCTADRDWSAHLAPAFAVTDK